MPMSAAERARKYREKIKQNPEEYGRYYKQKKHEYYMKTRKLINQQNEREQRKTRRNWRRNQNHRRDRLRKENDCVNFTPPSSPTDSVENEALQLGPPENVEDAAPQPGPSKGSISESAKKKRTQRKIKKTERKLKMIEEEMNKLKIKLKSSHKQNQRLKKQLENKSMATPQRKAKNQMESSPRSLRKTLVFHNALVKELQETSEEYCKKGKAQEKQILNKVLAGKVLKRYKLLSKAKKELGIVTTSQNRRKATTKSLKYDKKKFDRFSCKTTSQAVKKFFLQDINSRPAPGKKDTVTRQKIKMQKRYLNDTVKNLHKKFCQEFPGIKISYTAFNKLKPFWVVPVKARETCACRKCANIQHKAEALHQAGAIASKDLASLIDETTCSFSYNCAYGMCEFCKNKAPSYEKADIDDNKEVSWYTWVAKKETRQRREANGNIKEFIVQITVKEKENGTLKSLKEFFQNELKSYKVHKFNIEQQYKSTKQMKEQLSENECALHIDFSENYCCKYNQEIQSVHFGASRSQLALHTGVFYTKNESKSFCTISNNTRHDPGAIWAHLHPILENLGGDFSTIHIISDSPATQYRCAKNFYLFHKLIHRYNFTKATWNFTESGHEKSAADGVGGLVKRTADRIVGCGADILDAEALVQALQNEINVSLYLINDEDMAKVDTELKQQLKPVKGTMKIHQVISHKESLVHKTLSCFCDEPCDCFNPTAIEGFEDDATESSESADAAIPTVEYGDFLQSVADDDACDRGDNDRAFKTGDFVAVALETSKNKRRLYFGKVLMTDDEGGQGEISYMKKYKDHYMWTDKEDISFEPYENMVRVHPPSLADARRKFYDFPKEVIDDSKDVLKITK